MKIAVFAKKRTNKDGKPFTGYVGRLTKKSTGESVTVGIKFRMECDAPKAEKCPCWIEVPKGACNLDERTVIRESDGAVINSRTLWITDWKFIEAFVDTSMDDYE